MKAKFNLFCALISATVAGGMWATSQMGAAIVNAICALCNVFIVIGSNMEE